MHAALITTFLFALTAVCATQASLLIGAFRANAGRLCVAVVILAAWAHTLGDGLSGGQAGLFMLAGAVGFGAGGLCMFHAFPLIGSTLSLLIVECAATIATALLAWTAFGTGMTPVQAIGVLLCIGGVTTALLPLKLNDLAAKNLLAGVSFTLAAAVLQALSWVLSKGAFMEIANSGGQLGSVSAAYQRLLGGALVALAAMAAGIAFGRRPIAGIPGKAGPERRIPAAVWVLLNALAGPVFGVSCMLWAIREVDNPGLVQAVVATATLITVPMARRLEKRRFRPNYFIGAGISIAGVAALVLSAS